MHMYLYDTRRLALAAYAEHALADAVVRIRKPAGANLDLHQLLQLDGDCLEFV
jgi:hypothetical protein